MTLSTQFLLRHIMGGEWTWGWAKTLLSFSAGWQRKLTVGRKYPWQWKAHGVRWKAKIGWNVDGPIYAMKSNAISGWTLFEKPQNPRALGHWQLSFPRRLTSSEYPSSILCQPVTINQGNTIPSPPSVRNRKKEKCYNCPSWDNGSNLTLISAFYFLLVFLFIFFFGTLSAYSINIFPRVLGGRRSVGRKKNKNKKKN